MHFEELFNAGLFPINTVGEPGNHGAGITGKHGMGVSTPNAAAVAAATIGFARLLHIPNGGMFTKGLLSIIVAAGDPPANVLSVGSTTRELGASPKLHCIMAPATTSWPISSDSCSC